MRDKDRLIFKYMPVNQYLLTLLINGEFWMSPPDKLNDPFEGDFRIMNIKNYQNRAFIEKLLKFKHRSILDDFSYDEDLEKSLTDEIYFSNLLYEYVNQLIMSEFGITCFSRNHKSMKMWSHYADSHKGVCLVFKEKQLENSVLVRRSDVILKEIKYSNSLPSLEIVNHDADENGDDYIGIPKSLRFLYYKLSAWNDEKEVRFILRHNFNIFPDRRLKFDRLSLKGIIFGARTQLNDTLTIINLINSVGNYSGVNFYRARKEIDKLRIKMEKIKL